MTEAPYHVSVDLDKLVDSFSEGSISKTEMLKKLAYVVYSTFTNESITELLQDARDILDFQQKQEVYSKVNSKIPASSIPAIVTKEYTRG